MIWGRICAISVVICAASGRCGKVSLVMSGEGKEEEVDGGV